MKHFMPPNTSNFINLLKFNINNTSFTEAVKYYVTPSKLHKITYVKYFFLFINTTVKREY